MMWIPFVVAGLWIVSGSCLYEGVRLAFEWDSYAIIYFAVAFIAFDYSVYWINKFVNKWQKGRG